MEETPFELPAPERSLYEPALMVDVDGFEGPLDLLLALARNQQVDLTRISILALADQYLAFIAAQQRLRLEIAADYLVMAAWLAYLKSRLLLPGPPAVEQVLLGAAGLLDGLAAGSVWIDMSTSTPAVADGTLYLRTFTHLISLGGKARKERP